MNYRLTCSVFLTLTLTLFASAQGTKNPGRGTSTPPTTTTTPTRPTMNAPDMTMGQRAFISGKVVLDDGSRLTESATILTICRGHRQAVTHTDSHGSFSFEFGDRTSAAAAGVAAADADSSWTPAGGGARGNQRDWRDCELVADLPGFTSQTVDLSSRMSTFETTDIGRLVLHRIGEVEGLTISATSAMAPKTRRRPTKRATTRQANRNLMKLSHCLKRRSRFIQSTRLPGLNWGTYNCGIISLSRRVILSNSRSRRIPSTSIPTAAWRS